MSRNILPKDLETIFIKNILFELSDKEFLAIIDSQMSNLKKYVEGEECIEIFNFFTTSSNKTINYRKILAHSIWGKNIDLHKLDNERIKQINRKQEKFISINKIINIHDWLSGGTTITYEGVDGIEHKIVFEYPFDRFIINTASLVGSIYYDDKLVPVSSNLEGSIVKELDRFRSKGNNHALEDLLNFIQLGEYKNIANKLGR
ncbi:hypothetical protein FUAX_32700 [Fulvitalea axinellae]|uniref:Uncharacterized protein n=1 Tax=Fulvitalea axinellae TaxID=1182444 RepID=A0AAU9D4E4_9BACT|nr:hypothetical protein FUAX_32700 [Fulvitalea axinellae]